METLQRTANRGSISTGGYEIDNSLKLEADNAEYLYYTPSTQTDYERMAFSIWVKRTELGSGNLAEFGNGTSNTSNLRIGFDSSDRLFCYGNSIIWRQTNQVFRDTSAWYHLFFLFDTTTPGGISNNRIRIWVNGEMIPHTEFGVINNPGSGAAMGFNNALQESIGAQREGGPVNYFKGYIAQAYGSGGTPPVVTDFGEVDEDTGIWKPIDISELTPPDTQGFNLDFSDSSNLGNDISTRNNNFTLQNITSADQATDTPTNNFATYNVLVNNNTTETEGATRINSDSSFQTVPASIGVTSGKWYAEFKHNETGNEAFFGVVSLDGNNTDFGNHIGNDSDNYGVGMYAGNGNSYITGTIASFSSATSSSVVVGIALDMDNGYVYISKDGTWQNSGDPTSGSSGTGGLALAKYQTDIHAIAASCFNTSSSNYVASNFGGYTTISISSAATDENGYGNFEYAPPSGYYALCTKNLAEYG